jgi:hypothetical protein
MQQYFLVARIVHVRSALPKQLPSLELSYIEYDYHQMSYKCFLSLEKEYISIYKEYSPDIKKLINHSEKSYLLSTNMKMEVINRGMKLVNDEPVPAFIQDIITDHMTPQRIRKWVGRALDALSPSMVTFNRLLLSYLYDIKAKEEACKKKVM